MTGKLKNGEKKGSPTNNVIRSLIEEQQPDILCLQELKTQSIGDLAWLKTHYRNVYTNLSKHKKGNSGVALLCKEDPEWVETDFNRYDSEFIGSCPEDIAHEGRMVVAKFSTYIVVTVYTPNAQPDLVRIKERIQWESVLRMYLLELRREFGLNIILCGDLNCAHHEIDIHNPKSNKGSPGFSLEERREFQLMLDSGFVDSFRHLHPDRSNTATFRTLHDRVNVPSDGVSIMFSFPIRRSFKAPPFLENTLVRIMFLFFLTSNHLCMNLIPR